MSIYEMIESLEALEVPVGAQRVALKKKGYSDSEIEDALPKQAKRGFAAEFYDWLAEEPRERDDVEAFILDPSNSENVKKHLSHYCNIADLAAKIWEAK